MGQVLDLKEAIVSALNELEKLGVEERTQQRIEKFCAMGVVQQ